MNPCMRRRRGSTDERCSGLTGKMGNRESAAELLLEILCAGDDAGSVEWARGLSECQWNDIVRESLVQGIAPLLYARLRSDVMRTAIPARTSRGLRELTVKSTVKSLGLYSELSVVVHALRANGIDVLLLKGAHLASAVYDNRVERPMRDIDLLVRKRDLARAEATLFAMGYTRHPEKDGDFSSCEHLHPLVRPGGVPIEIHWTIVSPTEPIEIDLEQLWERAHSVRIAGVDVKVLSPEDLLLHVCVHAAFQHQFELGLRACWDIRRITHCFDGRIDWQQLRLRARKWGVEKYVYLTLRVAAELVQAIIPSSVLIELEPVGFEPGLIALAKKEVLMSRAAAVSVSPRFAEIWGTGKLGKKAGVLMEAMFPSRRALRRMYPTSVKQKWVYVFYVLRWRDLLRKYARSFLSVLCRERRTMSLVRWEHERARLMDWLKSVSAA